MFPSTKTEGVGMCPLLMVTSAVKHSCMHAYVPVCAAFFPFPLIPLSLGLRFQLLCKQAPRDTQLHSPGD